jgi:hypothetical protein
MLRRRISLMTSAGCKVMWSQRGETTGDTAAEEVIRPAGEVIT